MYTTFHNNNHFQISLKVMAQDTCINYLQSKIEMNTENGI